MWLAVYRGQCLIRMVAEPQIGGSGDTEWRVFLQQPFFTEGDGRTFRRYGGDSLSHISEEWAKTAHSLFSVGFSGCFWECSASWLSELIVLLIAEEWRRNEESQRLASTCQRVDEYSTKGAHRFTYEGHLKIRKFKCATNRHHSLAEICWDWVVQIGKPLGRKTPKFSETPESQHHPDQ